MTDQPTIGVIGPGAIAGVHATALAQMGVRIQAAAGPERTDLEEFCATYGVADAYDDHRALLDDPRIDAVIVAAPSALHAGLTLEAVAAGKDVLCEIPVAMSAADTDEVVAAADAAGLVVAVAHTLRYWEPHRALADHLADSGPAVHVSFRNFMYRQSNVGWTGKVRTWTDNVLWHHGAHAVDATLWALGASEVEVLGARGPVWHGSGVPMDVAAVLRTPEGGLGSVSLSYHSRAACNDVLVVTESTTFEIRDGRLWRDGELALDVGGVAEVQQRAVRAQDSDFLSAAAGRSASSFTAADALPTMKVLQALSAR